MRVASLLSSARWRTRATLWTAASLAGLAVVLFARLAELALATFFSMAHDHPWSPFLLAPTIGMVTVWLTRRYFPGSQGSGIPQVIAAIPRAAQSEPVGGLVSLRIALGKIGLGALALCGGFSAGREGPSVQVAASIVHAAHRYLPHVRVLRAQDLILAGGAAGVAAAFNTPLAGIVFAVEELGRRLERQTSGVLISTIILAGLVAVAFEGNYTYFGQLRVATAAPAIVVPIVASGLLCGVAGGTFSYMLLWPQRGVHRGIWRFRSDHPIWFAGICGLLVAALGWVGGGVSYGSGYSVTASVVAGQLELPWHAPLTRFLATVITYFSGIPGGIFAPSLAIGAAMGANAAPWLALGVNAQGIMALCMAGFLAAVTQAPITAAIIVMEMIDGHSMVISLMAVSLLAKAVGSRFSPPLYEQLSKDFR